MYQTITVNIHPQRNALLETVPHGGIHIDQPYRLSLGGYVRQVRIGGFEIAVFGDTPEDLRVEIANEFGEIEEEV